MKTKILALLKERGEINITEFRTLIPESKGEYSIYMPVKPSFNPNVLWMGLVTQEFIKCFNELLIVKELIDWNPKDILSYMIDNSPIYNVKLFKKEDFKKQTECWLPIVIFLKK
jgi:hypothetical protein